MTRENDETQMRRVKRRNPPLNLGRYKTLLIVVGNMFAIFLVACLILRLKLLILVAIVNVYFSKRSIYIMYIIFTVESLQGVNFFIWRKLVGITASIVLLMLL